MTDTAPIEPTPEPAPAELPPTDDAGWEARYRAEVADRIKERNLYKPAQKMLNDLDEDSRAELIRLAEMARQGDREGIIDWSLQTAEAASGKDVAALIAERQRAAQGNDPAPSTATPPTPAAPTAEEIAEMVRSEMARANALEAGKQQVASELDAAGYNVKSAPGQTIIQYAFSNNCDIATAVQWFENDTATAVLNRQRAAAAAAGSIPGTTPVGAPVGTIPDNSTPAEKATARLKAWASGTT
jgi:hypothetical protein